ncbi:MAG: hypothetical protein ABJA33_12940 [Pedococcus sp.]
MTLALRLEETNLADLIAVAQAVDPRATVIRKLPTFGRLAEQLEPHPAQG